MRPLGHVGNKQQCPSQRNHVKRKRLSQGHKAAACCVNARQVKVLVSIAHQANIEINTIRFPVIIIVYQISKYQLIETNQHKPFQKPQLQDLNIGVDELKSVEFKLFYRNLNYNLYVYKTTPNSKLIEQFSKIESPPQTKLLSTTYQIILWYLKSLEIRTFFFRSPNYRTIKQYHIQSQLYSSRRQNPPSKKLISTTYHIILRYLNSVEIITFFTGVQII